MNADLTSFVAEGLLTVADARGWGYLQWPWMRRHRKRRVTKKRVHRWMRFKSILQKCARGSHDIYAALAAFPEMASPRNRRRA